MIQQSIPAGEFKARCLKLMDEVNTKHIEIVITKHGKPVARLVPAAEDEAPDIFGSMRGTVRILGDIVGPAGVKWDANR